MRFAVSPLPGMLAAGRSEAEILRSHPDSGPEDIGAAIGRAVKIAKDRVKLPHSA